MAEECDSRGLDSPVTEAGWCGEGNWECGWEEEYRMTMVSVVIPVYNAEKYIKECLDSLLGQTFSDFEIICVDDGSQDHSLDILWEYEKRDRRISVLTQRNQYAGAARNAGMEQAEGKYLLFLDADDFFREDMLEHAVHAAKEQETEILVFDACRFDDGAQCMLGGSWKVMSKELFGDGLKSAEELSDVIYQFTTPAPWNKLFLREYVEQNRFRFQALPRTNDLFFTYSALSGARRIGVLDEKLLYYRVNNAASLQENLDESPAAFGEALYALKSFLNERGVWQLFRKSFADMAAAVCVNSVTNIHSEKLYKELCERLRAEIIPTLDLRYGMADMQLKEETGQERKIVVYGAGAVASAFVKYLLVCRQYDINKISVAVTSTKNSAASLHNIKIEEMDAVDADQKETPVIIAVSEEGQQKEMETYLRVRGFQKISKIGYGEMMGLFRCG